MMIFDGSKQHELKKFARVTPRNQPFIGLDVGKKTLGIAVCYHPYNLALPLEVIKRTKFSQDALKLRRLIDQRRVGALIVGLPFTMMGDEGRSAQSVRAFVANMLKIWQIPVMFWDERWSSKVVDKIMMADDFSLKRRKQAIDSLAAAYVLQGAIDRLRLEGLE